MSWFKQNYIKVIVIVAIAVVIYSIVLVPAENTQLKTEKWPGGPREENWAWDKHKECQSSNGHGKYDKSTRTYECWGITGYSAGSGKLIFREKFK